MQSTPHRRPVSFAAVGLIVVMTACAISACHSFAPPQRMQQMMMSLRQSTAIQRIRNTSPLPLFRELISDDEEDLRADIAVIKEQVGLDNFLKVDDRICVIK